MGYPLVTVITPTANRPEFLKRCIEQFLKQDYENKALTIVCSGESDIMWDWYSELCKDDYLPIKIVWHKGNIGDKRNIAITQSMGDIICHMDDDDVYSHDWITKSVEHLMQSKADITGLSNAYFYKQPDLLEFNYKGGQPYVLEATMCYWRKVWEQKSFPNQQTGEGLNFQINRKVVPHTYKTGFLAVMHGSNTASTKRMEIFTKTGLNVHEIYPFADLSW